LWRFSIRKKRNGGARLSDVSDFFRHAVLDHQPQEHRRALWNASVAGNPFSGLTFVDFEKAASATLR
jgi:hypothetical protein